MRISDWSSDVCSSDLRNLLTVDFERQPVDAVLALQPPLHQVHARVAACVRFAARPEAQDLAAANKRVTNLLKKAADDLGELHDFEPALATEPSEQALYACLKRLAPIARPQHESGDFHATLRPLAHARLVCAGLFPPSTE